MSYSHKNETQKYSTHVPPASDTFQGDQWFNLKSDILQQPEKNCISKMKISTLFEIISPISQFCFIAFASSFIPNIHDVLKSVENISGNPCVLVMIGFHRDEMDQVIFPAENYMERALLHFSSENKIPPRSRTFIKFAESCSLVIHRILSIPRALYGENWDSFPGGASRSFHVLIMANLPLEGALVKMKRKCRHVVIVLIGSTHSISSYDFDALWTVRLIHNSVPIFRDRSNFKGKPFIWEYNRARKDTLNQAMVSTYVESRHTVDRRPSFLTETSAWFNATPIVNTELSEYGNLDPATGEWSGIVGELVSGRAHSAGWLPLTRDRARDVLITSAGAVDGLIFMSGLRLHGNHGSGARIGTVLKEFAKSEVWILEMVAVGVISIVMMLVIKGLPQMNTPIRCFLRIHGELIRASLDQPFTPVFNT